MKSDENKQTITGPGDLSPNFYTCLRVVSPCGTAGQDALLGGTVK
jgi:hypothetical protein